jgi:outer membrane biosynthesis protein TonB
VRVLVSEQGQVLEAEALSGPEQLRDVAVKAAQQWTFKPMAVGSYPVKIIGVLIFSFRHT